MSIDDSDSSGERALRTNIQVSLNEHADDCFPDELLNTCTSKTNKCYDSVGE